MACTQCELNDCDCDTPDDATDDCDGCGADLTETDGTTFDMGDGSTIQLCPDCEATQDEED